MEKQELANLIHGRVRRNELTRMEDHSAKESGLVVVFGASDDLMEFRGAIYDEAGCDGGGDVYFTKLGKFPTEEHLETIKELESDLGINVGLPLNKIEAFWGGKQATWTYKTDIPHSSFEILEDEGDSLYCIGLVIEVKDLI